MSELNSKSNDISDMKTVEDIEKNESKKSNSGNHEPELTDTELTENNGFLNRIKNSINDTYDTLYNLPLLTLSIALFISINLILGLIFKIYYESLSLSSFNFISKLRLWTLISGTFMPSSILNYIFTLLFWIFKADKLERSLSTTRYFINFMIDAIFTAILFLVVSSLLPFYKTHYYNGLLSVVICENTLICLANPNVRVKFLFMKFSAKWYPIVLCLIMTIVHLGYVLDMLIGIFYAFIYFYVMRITISNESIEAIENKLFFFKNFDRFISISDLGKDDENKHKTEGEITIEKLDKSEREGKYEKANISGNQLSYINLEDEKVTTN